MLLHLCANLSRSDQTTHAHFYIYEGHARYTGGFFEGYGHALDITFMFLENKIKFYRPEKHVLSSSGLDSAQVILSSTRTPGIYFRRSSIIYPYFQLSSINRSSALAISAAHKINVEKIIFYDEDWNAEVNAEIDRLCSVFRPLPASEDTDTDKESQENLVQPIVYIFRHEEPSITLPNKGNDWIREVEDLSDQEGTKRIHIMSHCFQALNRFLKGKEENRRNLENHIIPVSKLREKEFLSPEEDLEYVNCFPLQAFFPFQFLHSLI